MFSGCIVARWICRDARPALAVFEFQKVVTIDVIIPVAIEAVAVADETEVRKCLEGTGETSLKRTKVVLINIAVTETIGIRVVDGGVGEGIVARG